MSTKWTDEQKRAIFSEKANILVAAGAGAGKTAVLVNRIIQKIIGENSDIDIDRLLVVTYTNAAASEMKERIGEEIQKSLEENFQSKKLQRQLTLLNQSNIMTMHSFCLKVIRDNFHLVDIDPNFRVANNEEIILLKQDSVLELFEEKYDCNDKNFILLVDSYGDKDDSKVKKMVLDLYEFSRSVPWPEKWLDWAAENFNLDSNFNFEVSKWAYTIIANLKQEIRGLIYKLKSAVELIHSDTGLQAYENTFYEDIHNFEELLGLEQWRELMREINSFKFGKLAPVKNKNSNDEIKQRVVKMRNDVKKSIKQIQDNIFGYTEDIGKSIKDMYPLMRSLVDLVNDFDNKYSSKKKERDIVDFSDIEHLCLDILTHNKDSGGKVVTSDTAIYYRNFFEEIFIDEYQDSNLVQETIINMIGRKDEASNLFMVGDVKQSIYRFRQAKPELFMEKYNSYSDDEDEMNRRIKLFKNFRSRPEIIDGVNFIFKQIMCREVGELEYDTEEELKSGAVYPQFSDDRDIFEGESIELHIIDKVAGEESEEDLDDDIRIEARLIANKINALVNIQDGFRKKVYDRNINAYRPIMYKDIVILMRATKNWSPAVVEELNNLRIPVFADTSTGYFETIEIRTIMSLLQIIDNPIQDIPLISVLRSPIESFSPEELIDIRMVNKDVPFYEALKNCTLKSSDGYSVDNIDDNLRSKVNNFIIQLNNWRKKVIYMPIDEFLWYLYMDTGYYGFVGAMPGGAQRQANLRMLFQKAEQYENSSYKGLFNFINFIGKLRSSSGDMGSARILGEDENVVRIMSVHKSKGLEFPVVIFAGAGKNFNMMDMGKPVLFNEQLGLGPDYVDSERRIRYPTVIKQILKRRIKIETISEEMRILYVAFTRAKEKLIITGMISNVEKNCRRWCEESIVDEHKVPEYALAGAKNYLDWIGEALVRHRDGETLRKAGSYEADDNILSDDCSKWTINLWKRESLFREREDNSEYDIIDYIRQTASNQEKSRYYEEIARRLDWKYRYYEASEIPAKFSVSELKRKFDIIDREESSEFVENVNLKKPHFIDEKSRISPSQRGTLVHLVMQHMDISKVDSENDIREQVQELVSRKFITEKESRVIFPHKIFRFFSSDLGMRMRKVRNVYREIPFYMQIDSGDIYGNLPEYIGKNEKVLIQGIIDCYFKEKDGIVLLDYKTDYVEDLEAVRNRYKIQIDYYSRAIEKMTGMKVKERYLYLFHKNTQLEI